MPSQEFSTYQKLLKEVSKKLGAIPGDENSFIKLESLFYDLLIITRTYSAHTKEDHLLVRLKHLQENEYKLTQEKYSKARQREVVIKKFRTAFKKEVAACLTAIASKESIVA